MASLALKTIQHNIRIPGSMVMSCSVLLMQFYPSPSRFLTLIDPVLMQPIIILPRTLEEKVSLAVDDDNIFLSPLLTSRDVLQLFPRALIISTDMDPCLDDNIDFSNKLIDAGVDVRMDVLEGLPHGFFAFSGLSSSCKEGFDHVTKALEQWI